MEVTLILLKQYVVRLGIAFIIKHIAYICNHQFLLISENKSLIFECLKYKNIIYNFLNNQGKFCVCKSVT